MKKNQAQSLAEYALGVSLVIMAIVGMQVYVKRGIQARLKTFVDGAGQGSSQAAGLSKPLIQYEPYYQSSLAESNQGQRTSTEYAQYGSSAGFLRRSQKPEENFSLRSAESRIAGVTKEEMTVDDGWEE